MITEPLQSEIAVHRGQFSAIIIDSDGRPAVWEIDAAAWKRDMRMAAAVGGCLEALTGLPQEMVVVHPHGYARC